jgi:hypothetical protein
VASLASLPAGTPRPNRRPGKRGRSRRPRPQRRRRPPQAPANSGPIPTIPPRWLPVNAEIMPGVQARRCRSRRGRPSSGCTRRRRTR